MLTLYSLLVVDGRRDGPQKGGYLAAYFLYCEVRSMFLSDNDDVAALWQACVQKEESATHLPYPGEWVLAR